MDSHSWKKDVLHIILLAPNRVANIKSLFKAHQTSRRDRDSNPSIVHDYVIVHTCIPLFPKRRPVFLVKSFPVGVWSSSELLP